MTDIKSEVLEELPHRLQVDPYVGYKSVNLSLSGGRVLVSGMYRVVKTDDVAKCHAYPKPEDEHAAPHEGCKCGFYAVADRQALYSGYTGVATVLLFGHVIVGEKGWRAQRQRITSIELHQVCYQCTQMGDGRRLADAMYFTVGGTPAPLCRDHGELAERINAALRMTPGEVADALSVDVRWNDYEDAA